MNTEIAQSDMQSSQLDAMKPRTLDQMLQYRATITPNVALLSCPSSGTDYQSYTAAQIDAFVENAAYKYYQPILGERSPKDEPATIALLGLADLEYIVTMFALYRLGHTVLALSPRLAKEAHSHLIASLNARYLLYHESQATMAEAIVSTVPGVELQPLVPDRVYRDPRRYQGRNKESIHEQSNTSGQGQQTAIIIHSSGSTGLPKPSRLSHTDLVMAASKNMNMRAFSCVPFFHGFGLNGLHRAIYSGREFFFYNASIPLTSKHLIDTITKCDFEIFFCVPYALKLLAETAQGIDALKKCKLVWFAGSACPDDLGEFLTREGIKLISDYGLSECGPLMTTMRPDDDHSWNYLRPLPHCRPYMRFEEMEEGTFELVCLDGLSWKTKQNREDGSYATKDLFQKHPEMPNAYRFIGRIDDTLVLSNGEKVNPVTLEGKIRRSSLVAESVVFGAGQSELGMVLIKSKMAEDLSNVQVMDRVWPLISEAQAEMPEHARIVRSMVIVLSSNNDYPRTDKGTIIRQKFYQKFSQQIEDAYTEEPGTQQLALVETELQKFIRDEVIDTLGLVDDQVLKLDTDLFRLGIDSLQSTQLRRKIQQSFDLGDFKLPYNVVYEHPTITHLVEFIMKTKSDHSGNKNQRRSTDIFDKLLEEHSVFDQDTAEAREQYIVLTGATGSLGAHVLSQLVQCQTVQKVYCPVRASSDQAASNRVMESLRTRKTYLELDKSDTTKIIALASDLAAPSLGLDVAIFGQIAREVTTVIHAAWPVNFNMSLASFEPDIIGTKRLLDLCLLSRSATPASFTFCSSVSTMMNSPIDETVEESVPSDPRRALDMGYAQSKLIAENMCVRAARRAGIKTYIMRIGQIVGDTKYGVWNPNEAIPMMLQTSLTIGGLPDIEEKQRWLPVDVVATSVVEISLLAWAPAGTVFNIVNPVAFRWKSDLLPKLRGAGLRFQELPVAAWLDKLTKSDQNEEANPPVKLLHHFESRYGEDGGEAEKEDHCWEVKNAFEHSPTFRAGWQLSPDLLQKFITYFKEHSWKAASKTRPKQLAHNVDEPTLKSGNSSDPQIQGTELSNTSMMDSMQRKAGSEQDYSRSDHDVKIDHLIAAKDAHKPEVNDKIFWNDKKQKIDVHGINLQTSQNDDMNRTDRPAKSVEVGIDVPETGWVVAWTGTGFKLCKPEDSEQKADNSPLSLSSSLFDSNESTSEEPVVVLREGEIGWNAETSRFDVGLYGLARDNDQPAKRPAVRFSIDVDALRQPKTLVWDGTRFTCK